MKPHKTKDMLSALAFAAAVAASQSASAAVLVDAASFNGPNATVTTQSLDDLTVTYVQKPETAGNVTVSAPNGFLMGLNPAELFGSGNVYIMGVGTQMRFDFANPVSAFGFDFIYRSSSAFSFQVFNSANNVLDSATVPGGSDSAFTSIFVGLGLATNAIDYALISYLGPTVNWPDGDGGFVAGMPMQTGFYVDNLIYQTLATTSTTPPTNQVPEPATALLAGLGLAGIAAVRRRRAV